MVLRVFASDSESLTHLAGTYCPGRNLRVKRVELTSVLGCLASSLVLAEGGARRHRPNLTFFMAISTES